MLKLKHLFENYELAKSILQNWNYDTERLDEMLSWFRISSNAIYPFSYKQKMHFLRLAPTDEKLQNNIYGELEFINFLRANNYPAMKPVASIKGEYILKVNTKWGEYYTSVFERVEGIQIENTDYNSNIMFQYGKTLGKLHKLSSNYKPQTEKWNYKDVLNWMITELQECNNSLKAISNIKLLQNELDKLPKNKNNFGLVHYDFEQDNVFYSDETNSCYVIDFDDGMYHWFAIDIEQCFDSLSDVLKDENLERAKAQFIDGYQTEFELTNETLNLLPLMRRFANLFKYTRIVRSLNDTFEIEPTWLTDLRLNLATILSDIEHTFY